MSSRFTKEESPYKRLRENVYYPATLLKVEPCSLPSPHLRWTFILHQPELLVALLTADVLQEGGRFDKAVQALSTCLKIGESIDLDDLILRECRVLLKASVGKDGVEYYNVVRVYSEEEAYERSHR